MKGLDNMVHPIKTIEPDLAVLISIREIPKSSNKPLEVLE
jgi:hypothetical protein